MRILATREAGDVPEIAFARGAAAFAAPGILEPLEEGDSYAARWDPRDELRTDIDLGWIGEEAKAPPDKGGIWTRRHPEAAVLEDPEVHAVITQFRSCSDRELQPSDYETRSHKWIRLWLEALAASQRKHMPKKDGES